MSLKSFLKKVTKTFRINSNNNNKNTRSTISINSILIPQIQFQILQDLVAPKKIIDVPDLAQFLYDILSCNDVPPTMTELVQKQAILTNISMGAFVKNYDRFCHNYNIIHVLPLLDRIHFVKLQLVSSE